MAYPVPNTGNEYYVFAMTIQTTARQYS